MNEYVFQYPDNIDIDINHAGVASTVLLLYYRLQIDAVLSPVIARQLIKKGFRHYIKLGDKEVEYSPKFKLYLHTK